MKILQPKSDAHVGMTPNWQAMDERQKMERQKHLPNVDTSAAIHEFRLAWKAAMAAGMEPRRTGLVEQQACFSRLREPATH